MIVRACTTVFIVVTALALRAEASALRYVVTDLNIGPGAHALAVNSNGDVVGYYFPTGSGGTDGFFYKDGAMQDIPSFGGTDCEATALNDSDVVVGWADNMTAGFTKPFSYDVTTMTKTNLGTIGGNEGFASGVNASGSVSGTDFIAGNSVTHASIRLNGNNLDADLVGNSSNYSVANGINASGLIVGNSHLNTLVYPEAVLFSRNAAGGSQTPLGTLGGDAGSTAYAINDAGLIVGSAYTANNASVHAFLYDSAGAQVMQDLGTIPGGLGSQASAINNQGQIVGYANVDVNDHHAIIFLGGAMRDLNTLIPSGSDWVLAEANGINDSGVIVGFGFHHGDGAAFLLTPTTVPSPTVALAAKPRIKTSKKKLVIKGTAGGEVSSVTYTIDKGGAKTATGTGAWSLTTGKLKRGKTVITVIAHGYGGDSAPAQVTIIHS